MSIRLNGVSAVYTNTAYRAISIYSQSYTLADVSLFVIIKVVQKCMAAYWAFMPIYAVSQYMLYRRIGHIRQMSIYLFIIKMVKKYRPMPAYLAIYADKPYCDMAYRHNSPIRWHIYFHDFNKKIVNWLVWMKWHPAGWSVCLPLLISPCTIKSRCCLLASAHPGGPRKSAVEWLW